MNTNDESTNATRESTIKRPAAQKSHARWFPALVGGGAVLACLIIGLIGYLLGSHSSKHAMMQHQFYGGQSRMDRPTHPHREGRRGPVTVTKISDSSITVKSQRTGSEKTYSITSNTQIVDNKQTKAASDIKQNSLVTVKPDPTDRQKAAMIQLSPTL